MEDLAQYIRAVLQGQELTHRSLREFKEWCVLERKTHLYESAVEMIAQKALDKCVTQNQ